MTISVSSSAALRTAIQNITYVGPIVPAAGSYSVTTLAKIPSFRSEPAVPLINTYSIQGASRTGTIINDTRIYQPNIDGAFGPRTVDNLTLQYNSSTSNNTAILNATTGTYILNRLNIQGQHGGWAGNGGVYMALTTSNGNTPINTNLTLQRSTISVTGQTGTASFLQSWNNTGNVLIGGSGAGNTFNETGYNRGSFHFASMYPGGTQGTKRGTYTVRDNTFNGNGTTRDNSNRLENVVALVQGNTFNNGSYLDLAGNLNNTQLFSNTFNTISGGYGIRFTQKSSSLALLDSTGLVLSGSTFTGYGLPIVNNDAAIATASVVKVTSVGSNMITLPNIGTKSPDVFYAGGRFADTITDLDGTPDWINGGAGNDSIDGGDGDDWIIGGAGNDTITTGTDSMDTVLYYDPSEGNDIITDFSDSTSMTPDTLGFRSSTFGNLTSGTFIDGTNFISDPTLPVAPTTGPTFLYNSTTGQLTYDSNGSAAGGISSIATLSGAPALTVADFKFF
jgi:Ca2+-binding RTX toxin-like protein